MSDFMRKYVTHCENCQHFFYEIIETNVINHQIIGALIHWFHGLRLIFAYFSCPVNDFYAFCKCPYRRLTGTTLRLRNCRRVHYAVSAHSGSQRVCCFSMA